MRCFLIIILILSLPFSCASTKIVKKQPESKPIAQKQTKKAVKQELTLRFPVPGGEITSPFGYRKGEYHRGVDIGAPVGTPVLSCLNGLVIRAGFYKFAGGYGKSILVKHDEGLFTYYAHLNAVETKRGDWVDSGQRIGRVGNTGRSRGPHLHLELIKNKKLLNAESYFEAKYITTARDVLYKFKEGFPLSSCIKKLISDY